MERSNNWYKKKKNGRFVLWNDNIKVNQKVTKEKSGNFYKNHKKEKQIRYLKLLTDENCYKITPLICKLPCCLLNPSEHCHTHLAPVQVWWQRWELVIHIICNIIHEPLKTFATQSLFQSQLLTDISHVQESGEGFSCVEVLFEFVVKPCFYHSFVVLQFMKNVWYCLTEHICCTIIKPPLQNYIWHKILNHEILPVDLLNNLLIFFLVGIVPEMLTIWANVNFCSTS